MGEKLDHDGYNEDCRRFTHVGQRVRLMEDVLPFKKGAQGVVRGLDPDDDSGVLVEFDGVPVDYQDEEDGGGPLYPTVWSRMLEVLP